MADETDEEVIFENSPLERYLKEAGFTDIDPEKVDRLENQAGEINLKDAVVERSPGLKDWLLTLHQKYFILDIDKLLSVREKYTSIVINSGTLSEDDYTFLHHFDPDLFDFPEEKEDKKKQPQMFSLRDWMPERLVSIIIILLAVLLASNYWQHICDHKGSSIGGLLVITFFGYYVWRLHNLRAFHHRNMHNLENYASEIKTFISIFRKSVMLIQELELISKGYTLVGVGMQIGYQQKDDEGECTRDIYPKLRQSLCDNGINVLMKSCSIMERMFATIPFAPEVSGVFTCISSSPLSQFGLQEYSQSEKLSLHYLKILLSAIASQQSEFLSRFLLSLSDKAKLSEMTLDKKHFQSLFSGFYDQLMVVTEGLKSLELSYHLHKSALTFAGDHELQCGSSNSKPQSKWTNYYTSVHSLELHLKACLTRMQFINTFMTAESESYELTSSTSIEDPSKDTCNAYMKELEYNYSLLRNELDSAICCWEEGFHNLKMISGRSKSETITTKEDIDEKEDLDEHPSSAYQSRMKEPEEVVGDCVFEGYTDLDDDSDFQQTRLTREELEKESRSREESQHLLQELKNVLVTKAKDPLITDAGFVKPSKRQRAQDENTPCSESEDSEFLDLDSNVNDNIKKYSNTARAVNESSDSIQCDSQNYRNGVIEEDIRDCKEPLLMKTKQVLPCSQWSSSAFSLAIQEAARSRGNALMEESYGSSDSD